MIIMDNVVISENGQLEVYKYNSNDSENKRKFLDARNDTYKVYKDLYETGELENIADYVRIVEESDKMGEYTQIYFVLDSDKISAERKAEFAEKYPMNHVSKLCPEKYTPCSYTGCVTLGYTYTGLGMLTYRDVYGNVGKSWESPFVQTFHYPDIVEFAEIRKKSGIVKACIACFEKLFNGTGMTSEEYDALVEQAYAE